MEIDRKFVAGILSMSDTKKTILVAKGEESGLKVGDHAKISTNNGMVARAIVAKLSPSRSIWSVYRFFEKSALKSQASYVFKIASAVVLTEDESKSLGTLAQKYGKSDKEVIEIPTKEKIEQKRLQNNFIRKDRVVSQFDKEDYSTLEDDGAPRRLDVDIDWTALDGKKDLENYDSNVDYSALK